MLHQVNDIARLRGGALQKFAPHRGIEKEVANQESGACGSPHLLKRGLFRPLHHQMSAGESLRRLGDDLHHGHCADAGESLTPKAKAGDADQILRTPDLAGGMAQKSGSQLIPGDARSVVRDAYEAYAPVFDLHGDRTGSGINSVLHQFFYHAGGAFHNLTGSDPVYGLRIQYLYLVHLSFPPKPVQSESNKSSIYVDARITALCTANTPYIGFSAYSATGTGCSWRLKASSP